ncbi:hypothetical protein [Pseudotabrizicola sp. L79]|uniref:hypothetical protein n=1 Tax=Pseudotabrizicola sp. L79 TaxID=3118402 RepID=UPI002F92ECB5
MNFADMDYWRLAEVLGVWAAAFATYYAARTALRIASDQVRVQLQPSASLGWFVLTNGSNQDAIILTVTNSGNRDVVVREIAWHHYFLGSARAVHFPGHYMDQAKLPFKIGFSESRSFYIDRFGPSGDWLEYFAHEMLGNRGWLGRFIVRRTLSIRVTTGDDQIFKKPVARSLIGGLDDAYSRITA